MLNPTTINHDHDGPFEIWTLKDDDSKWEWRIKEGLYNEDILYIVNMILQLTEI